MSTQKASPISNTYFCLISVKLFFLILALDWWQEDGNGWPQVALERVSSVRIQLMGLKVSTFKNPR